MLGGSGDGPSPMGLTALMCHACGTAQRLEAWTATEEAGHGDGDAAYCRAAGCRWAEWAMSRGRDDAAVSMGVTALMCHVRGTTQWLKEDTLRRAEVVGTVGRWWWGCDLRIHGPGVPRLWQRPSGPRIGWRGVAPRGGVGLSAGRRLAGAVGAAKRWRCSVPMGLTALMCHVCGTAQRLKEAHHMRLGRSDSRPWCATPVARAKWPTNRLARGWPPEVGPVALPGGGLPGWLVPPGGGDALLWIGLTALVCHVCGRAQRLEA